MGFISLSLRSFKFCPVSALWFGLWSCRFAQYFGCSSLLVVHSSDGRCWFAAEFSALSYLDGVLCCCRLWQQKGNRWPILLIINVVAETWPASKSTYVWSAWHGSSYMGAMMLIALVSQFFAPFSLSLVSHPESDGTSADVGVGGRIRILIPAGSFEARYTPARIIAKLIPTTFPYVRMQDFLRSRPGKPNQRKGQNEKSMNFAHFLWILPIFLRKASTIHIEFLFRNAPAKSSWTDLSSVWFAGATPDSLDSRQGNNLPLSSPWPCHLLNLSILPLVWLKSYLKLTQKWPCRPLSPLLSHF